MRQACSRATMRPRLGIVAHAPIQYHTPLFQLLAKRDNIDLDILFLSDRGRHRHAWTKSSV